eukprot:8279718-Alexandrium_andersonii.AAC.1
MLVGRRGRPRSGRRGRRSGALGHLALQGVQPVAQGAERLHHVALGANLEGGSRLRGRRIAVAQVEAGVA